MKFRCAMLDDFQNAALNMADWSVMEDRVEVKAFHKVLFSDLYNK